MAFIETVPEGDAAGDVAELYGTDRDAFGFVPNFTQAFSNRPATYAAWRQLNATIKSGMDLRRYELATIAAARRLRSSYCMLAHGSTLMREQFLEPESLRSVVADYRSAGLDAVDIAVMDLAEKVADEATAVTQADIDGLRAHGLSDADIMDVVLAAAARCFFSKTLDALGVEPDARYSEQLEPAVCEALTVGRPIATA
jgi:uncharacterized peroxidase-related enzyme